MLVGGGGGGRGWGWGGGGRHNGQFSKKLRRINKGTDRIKGDNYVRDGMLLH